MKNGEKKRFYKFKCPYCKDIYISKKESPKACPLCHFKNIKLPKKLKEVEI
jgi:rubrerythrin